MYLLIAHYRYLRMDGSESETVAERVAEMALMMILPPPSALQVEVSWQFDD